MEAKDTVINQQTAKELFVNVTNLGGMLQTQAAITWNIAFEDGKKAGIKEAVEWANQTCPHDLGEGTQNYKRVCDLCWQAKLKEWRL